MGMIVAADLRGAVARLLGEIGRAAAAAMGAIHRPGVPTWLGAHPERGRDGRCG
jgi:hypothetical protein